MPTAALWMQTTGTAQLATERRCIVRLWTLAQDSRSAHGLLYLTAVRSRRLCCGEHKAMWQPTSHDLHRVRAFRTAASASMTFGMSACWHRRRAIRNKIRMTANGATASTTRSTASPRYRCYISAALLVSWAGSVPPGSRGFTGRLDDPLCVTFQRYLPVGSHERQIVKSFSISGNMAALDRTSESSRSGHGRETP
jgi:hypothetical protein